MRLWDGSFPEPGVADIHLNLERCKGCGLCIGACPIDNVRLTENLNSKGYCYAEIIDNILCGADSHSSHSGGQMLVSATA